jgi:hypothetical protein
MGLGGTGLEYVDQIQLVQYTVEWHAFVNTAMNYGFYKWREFIG